MTQTVCLKKYYSYVRGGLSDIYHWFYNFMHMLCTGCRAVSSDRLPPSTSYPHLACTCDPEAMPWGISPPEAWLQPISMGMAKQIFTRWRKTCKHPIRQTHTYTRTVSLSNASHICWFWKNLIKVSCEISKEKKTIIPYNKCGVIVLGSPCVSPLTGLTVRQHNLGDQKAETGHACFSSFLEQRKW